MEGIAAEVSQKLKAAIKAKLMELGLYVDDQLPNYVMVMVTNRRNKREMDKELQLFLGENTNHFTSWLQSVWQKLEQVTIQPALKRRSSSSSDLDKSKKKKKLKKSQRETSDKNSAKSSKVDDELAVIDDGKFETEFEKLLDVDESELLKENSSITSADSDATKSSKNNDTRERIKSANSSNKTKTQLSKEFEDEDDFLNIKEDIDVDDFLSDSEDSVTVTTTPIPKIIVEKSRNEGKPVKPAEDGVASKKKLLPSAKEIHSVKKPVSASSEKKPTQTNDVEAKSSSKSISTSVPSKPRFSRDCIRRTSVTEEKEKHHEEILTSKSKHFEENPSSKISNTSQRTTTTTNKSISKASKPAPPPVARITSSHSNESVKRTDEKDNYVDAREVLNRKRAAQKSDDNHRRRSRSNEKSIVKIDLSSGRNSRKVVSSGIRVESKRHERDENDKNLIKNNKTNKIVNDKNRNEKISRNRDRISDRSRSRNRNYSSEKSDSDDSKNREYSPELARKRAHSPVGEIRNIKRTVANSKYDSSDEESGDDENVVVRSHIISDDDEPAPDPKRKVESTANYAQPPTRPKQPTKDAAGGNLLRKAFAEVQRSLIKPRSNTKEKNVRIKRGNIKAAGSGPVKKQNAASSAIKSSGSNVEKRSSDTVNEELINKVIIDDDWVSPDPSEVSVSVDENSISQTKEKFVPKVILDPKPKSTDVVNSSSTQKTPNSLKSTKNAEPVEEYDPEQNMPQFVVTLTGLNPSMYPNVNCDDIEMTELDTDQEMRDVKPAPPPKKLERCRFWPNCLNGEMCPYIHPTTLCKAFPNCKFGNSCLYIHPKCKFDSSCTRFDCPFSHSDPVQHTASVAPIISMKPTSSYKPPCKFFPNCVNSNCPFQHPKPCRFDKYCNNRSCPFTHTTLVNASSGKLKWTNPHIYAAAAAVATTSATTTTMAAVVSSTVATTTPTSVMETENSMEVLSSTVVES